MAEEIDIVVGRRLRTRRRIMGMSQQALGGACGVTFQQIHKYESAVCRLSANMLWRLAAVLEVDVGYFFADLPRNPPLPVARTQTAELSADAYASSRASTELRVAS